MVSLTIQGGFDTTGSAIGNALLYLDGDPVARQALIDDPGLVVSAAEEFLRFEAPQLALARMATRDVEIGGELIREGEHVLLVWASGNRDDSAFPDPDSVVLDRFPNRHMTFGLGAHRCLGSTLARRQLTLTLSAVLHRMPDFTIDRKHAVRAETVGVTYGHMSLPATFTPGSRFRLQSGAESLSHN
jgi:cytochrome P450